MEIAALGVKKLGDQLSHEYQTFKGAEDQIDELKSNLDLLRSFMEDVDTKKRTNETMRHFVEEINEIVYDAEDSIVTSIHSEKKNSGVVKIISRFVDRRRLVSGIQGITKRISKVIQDMKNFGVQPLISDATLSALALQRQEKLKEMQQQFAKSAEKNLVGLEGNVKTLIGYLADDYIQVISVTGMGGLGKTTLARQVFEHDVVRKEFKRLAWVCVTKEFTRVSFHFIRLFD